MKRKNRKSDHKIGTELTFMMVLMIILAIVALMIISIAQFSSLNNQQAIEIAATGAKTLMNHLESESANAFRLATLLAINPNITAGIESGSKAQLDAATDGLLESVDIDFVTILDEQGTVIYRLQTPEKFGDSLKDKSDVVDALAGNATHGFQKAEAIPLSASAAVPVYSKTNKIVGVIITGKRLDDSEMLDSLKEITDTELTLFRDDVRVATSIIQNGERQIGNTMAANIAAIVIDQTRPYTGRTTLNGEAFYVHYMPLVSVKGEVVGALVGAESLTSFNTMLFTLIAIIIVISIVLTAIVAAVIIFYIRAKVSKPLAAMGRNADELARGNVDLNLDVDMTSESKNEIVALRRSFSNMAENIRQNALAAERLAHGQVDSEIIIRSDKDILSQSLRQVSDAVRALVTEAGRLTASTIRGQLSVRGDADAFEGGYRDIVSGVNQTLDAVVKPIEEAAGVLSKMADGNLSEHMLGDYQGDHAVIKNALNGTLESLNAYVGEIAATLTAMANANLNISIVRDYKGDFAPIKQALNLIIDNFNNVLTDMNSASEQVAAGSRQFSDGSQALASGATEQAASIEELTSTITEIAQQTRLNAENASEANQLALTAHANAQIGNEQMGELQKAMTEINESSASISKIIKVIDDIAFQTNILALNAAVEAARAGQHGKGFAVVAEEVRTLAARSASAAKETTDLIENSISKTEAGTKLSDKTAEALIRIVGDVAKAADLVGLIATASDEQAGGIAQVNIGINQVTQVVQSNSATAEESAATSEELAGQADLLKQMISRFNLRR